MSSRPFTPSKFSRKQCEISKLILPQICLDKWVALQCYGNLGAPEIIELQDVADIILLAPQVAADITALRAKNAELEARVKELEEWIKER